MGIAENMQHLEKYGGVSRRKFEEMRNGKCSYSINLPNLKRRKFSAVRDFPEGCGPNAPRIHAIPTEAANSAYVNGENSALGDKNEAQASVSGAEAQMEMPGLKTDLPRGSGLPVDLYNASMNDLLNPSEQKESKSPENSENVSPMGDMDGLELKSSPSSTFLIKNEDIVEKTMSRNYPPRRKISAIRDFPSFCGRNAPCLSKEESMKVKVSSKSMSGEHRLGVDGKSMAADIVKDEGNHKRKFEMTGQNKHRVESENKGIKVTTKGLDSVTSSEHEEEIADLKWLHDTKMDIGKGKEISVYDEEVGKEISVYDDEGGKEITLYHENLEGKNKQLGQVDVVYNIEEQKGKGKLGNEIMLHSKNKSVKKGHSEKKNDILEQRNLESTIKKKKFRAVKSSGHSLKRNRFPVRDEADSINDNDDEHEDIHVARKTQEFNVSLLPFGQSSSSGRHDNDSINIRNKVRETLRIFQVVFRKLVQEEEAKSKQGRTGLKRIDLAAAKIVKSRGKYVNVGKPILGEVPGVQVGDEFHYRVELAIVGLHRPLQAGIDCKKHGGQLIATSIVASGKYADDLEEADVLIYMGSGGNITDKDKIPEDQKLEKGNLALKNSAQAKSPVRVIRGFKETKAPESSGAKAKTFFTYTYDGLYLVEKYWQEIGPHGKLVFQFQLVRIPNQPKLAWTEVKKSNKLKIREGVVVSDISQGKEVIPICAINTLNEDTPPQFKYIRKMIYPNWCNPIPIKGCDCTNGCSESKRCSCAMKNGGEIPYNHNGAIVEAKTLVYECGPSCKCPPSCSNRVSQHGLKFQLEIFKTESMGWGVRSLNSISSGSFICEYLGELLDDKEAEQRTGSDEYLFDIGQNYSDHSTLDGGVSKPTDPHVEESGFTIDAAQYGNIGRFINHSCSPNLYAQNVLYDHEDKRMPHIMLFAAENIPPLQELTYHYNYTMDQVYDSNGNIKKKSCFCGSPECVGRMY